MTALQSHHSPEVTPPTPDRHPRHDGLTPERRAAFLDALAATGCVSEAAAEVGISRAALYKLRNHPDGAAFRADWDAALCSAMAVLAETAFERALRGTMEPIWHNGEQVGERVRHNDRLLMFLMRSHDPATYGNARANAAAPARPRGMAPAPALSSPAQTTPPARPERHPVLVSTSSTSQIDDAEEEYGEAMDAAAFRAALREVRNPPPPQHLSKRNARRLAAKARAQPRGAG